MKGDFVFAVPGDLGTPTGGYAYDKRMIAELRELGWRPEVLNLGEGFPRPNTLTRAGARAAADLSRGVGVQPAPPGPQSRLPCRGVAPEVGNGGDLGSERGFDGVQTGTGWERYPAGV